MLFYDPYIANLCFKSFQSHLGIESLNCPHKKSNRFNGDEGSGFRISFCNLSLLYRADFKSLRAWKITHYLNVLVWISVKYILLAKSTETVLRSPAYS